MIVLIDNYDSFTFNLFHYLGGLGADVAVYRNDKISVADVMASQPDAIVLSPGPCTPNEAGICLALIEKAAPAIPILGVCLGHRAVIWWRSGAGNADPRQGLGDQAYGYRDIPWHQRPPESDALSFARG